VAVIVMENHGYDQIIGNHDAPYINALAHGYALATDYFAVDHPSLPNYLALAGGSTYGITSDCTDCRASGDSLVNQLTAAGIAWTAYLQGVPSPCFTGPEAGRYAKKHNPFAYFASVTGDPALCSHLVPASRLPEDVSSGRLPTFVWLTPDLCDDMHDCSVATGDAYLSRTVPDLLAALGPRGALFLVWDEAGGDDSGCCAGRAHGGHVTAVVAGSAARKGATSSVAYDHFSVLRTIEDGFGLPRLGEASCSCTQPMTDLLAGR
jgi:phospholipase C